MIRTYGLTHLSLAVKDLERTLRFYRKVFGAKVYWREEGSAQVKTPGCHDVIAFDRPGFGYSERPRTVLWTAQAQAALLARALGQLGIDKATVVGHSFGTTTLDGAPT